MDLSHLLRCNWHGKGGKQSNWEAASNHVTLQSLYISFLWEVKMFCTSRQYIYADRNPV